MSMSMGGNEGEALCDINTTPAKIQQVERALQSRGFTVNVDG